MPNRGTPDNTRGTVAPQRLIGSFLATDQVENVAVPDNAATLIIICRQSARFNVPTVVGLATGTLYPVEYKAAPVSNNNYLTFFVSTAEAEDGNLQIIWPTAPGAPWFVISDAAVRTVTASIFGAQGVGMWQDQQGQSYVVTAAPGPGSNDHPPQEIKFAYTQITSTNTILAAPGAGLRYRIFAAQLQQYGALGSTSSEVDLPLIGGSPRLITGAIPGSAGMPQIDNLFSGNMPLTGLPCTTNSGVTGSTTGGAFFRLAYTLENV